MSEKSRPCPPRIVSLLEQRTERNPVSSHADRSQGVLQRRLVARHNGFVQIGFERTYHVERPVVGTADKEAVGLRSVGRSGVTVDLFGVDLADLLIRFEPKPVDAEDLNVAVREVRLDVFVQRLDVRRCNRDRIESQGVERALNRRRGRDGRNTGTLAKLGFDSLGVARTLEEATAGAPVRDDVRTISPYPGPRQPFDPQKRTRP